MLTPLTYRQQLVRDILAQHELDRAKTAGPRKPGRGRPPSDPFSGASKARTKGAAKARKSAKVD